MVGCSHLASLKTLNFHRPAFICCSCLAHQPVIGSPNVTDSLNPSYSQANQFAPFDPFMIPELVKCLLIEYHRKVRGHYCGVSQGKSLQSETSSYFSAIKGTSNGGEVAHLFLFGETKWLALHRPAVHEC